LVGITIDPQKWKLYLGVGVVAIVQYDKGRSKRAHKSKHTGARERGGRKGGEREKEREREPK